MRVGDSNSTSSAQPLGQSCGQAERRVSTARLLDAEDGAGDRARVAVPPPPALDLVEEVLAELVEERRVLEVDVVPGVRHHREPRALDVALHEDRRVEA